MVCMDLCSQFRSVVQRLFPRAKIVADRFHVIRLVIDTLLDFSREAEPDIRWQRGIIAMLRKNGEHDSASSSPGCCATSPSCGLPMSSRRSSAGC